MPRPVVYSPRRFAKLVGWILRHGNMSSPREMETMEVIDASLILRNPTDRLVFDPARKMNLAFAIADWVQMMVGDDDMEFLADFVPKIRDFADPEDSTKIGGAYGPRLINSNQFGNVLEKLRTDPDTRQAVITIYDGKQDLSQPGHVVPCTISLQFLIRDNRLHCIANMRSNDVVWGLTYDVFNFTMIQEQLAACLGVALGFYYHHAGSLHLYLDRDKEMVEKLSLKSRFNVRMSSMEEQVSTYKLFQAIKLAKDLATRDFWTFLYADLSTQYEQDMALATRYWMARKEAPYEAQAAYNATADPAFRRIMKQWPAAK